MHYRKLSIGAVNGLRTSHDFKFMIDRSGRTTFPRPHPRPAGSSGSTGYAGQGQMRAKHRKACSRCKPSSHEPLDGKEIMRSNYRRRLERNRKFVDSPLEGDGFEPVWGSSCQVVVSGLWPVFCSEQESRSSSRRLRSGLRSARKGSRDRNASKLSGVPLSGACVWQRLEA